MYYNVLFSVSDNKLLRENASSNIKIYLSVKLMVQQNCWMWLTYSQVSKYLTIWYVAIGDYSLFTAKIYISWKVSVIGVTRGRIFPHSEWIRRDTEYLSVFSPNAGKWRPEHFLRSDIVAFIWWMSKNSKFDECLKNYVAKAMI